LLRLLRPHASAKVQSPCDYATYWFFRLSPFQVVAEDSSEIGVLGFDDPELLHQVRNSGEVKPSADEIPRLGVVAIEPEVFPAKPVELGQPGESVRRLREVRTVVSIKPHERLVISTQRDQAKHHAGVDRPPSGRGHV